MAKCPECGQDIVPAQAHKHAIYHWGPICPDPSKYPEAAARYTIVLKIGGEK